MGKMEHLIMDANAFLKNLPLQAQILIQSIMDLQDMGENIYTIPEVITEIRDAATRQRLQVLSYDLKFKEPLPEAIQFITKFSKATGDYLSLSAVDIRLMALAYQLTKEQLGPEASTQLLKLEPENVKTETVMGSGASRQKKDTEAGETSNSIEQNSSEVTVDEPTSNCPEEHNDPEHVEELDEDDSEHVEEEEEDDDEGWITPSNYKNKLKEMEGDTQPEDESTHIPVACLTTDFAMQNVLLHIGLRVLSTNGMLVKNIRTYILRCYSCFRTTSIMTKVFCPSCGNKTLKRVSVSYKEDGTLVLHLSRRVNLSGRGKKFPLPAPKGGKHAKNPILTEDQRIPQQRPSKMAMQKNNPLGTDYIANSSPFTVNDVYSRAANLGINTKFCGTSYWEKKNPNEARKRIGKKKNNN